MSDGCKRRAKGIFALEQCTQDCDESCDRPDLFHVPSIVTIEASMGGDPRWAVKVATYGSVALGPAFFIQVSKDSVPME